MVYEVNAIIGQNQPQRPALPRRSPVALPPAGAPAPPSESSRQQSRDFYLRQPASPSPQSPRSSPLAESLYRRDTACNHSQDRCCPAYPIRDEIDALVALLVAEGCSLKFQGCP